MTCPNAAPNWWSRYLAGEFKTPRDLVAAAYAEMGQHLDQTERFFGELPEDTATWNAPDRLKAPAWFHNTSFLKQQERADYTHADGRLVVWAALFQKMAAKREIPLYVHSCLRGEAEQNALAAKGNSKLRYPSSAHNIGEAVDIVHGVYHWDMTPQEWKLLHALGNLALDRVNALLKKEHKLDLTWGGSWTFYDPAHWEIRDYRQRLRRLAPPASPVRWNPTQALAARDRLLPR